MPSHVDLLTNRPSHGANTLARTGFKIYQLIRDGTGGYVSGYPGDAALEALGIGYGEGVGLHSVTVQATVQTDATGVKTYIDGKGFFPRITYLDYEAGSTVPADILNTTGWVRNIFGTSRAYGAIGWYGGDIPAMHSPGFAYPHSWTPALVSSSQTTNNTNLSGIQGTTPQDTEWIGPELYCNMNIDRLYCHMKWFSDEYTRLGLTIPLIPLINPAYPPGRSFTGKRVPGNYWRAILEAGIRLPNISGFYIWHADRNAAWDATEGWYVQTLDFISTYGLSLGTPF